MNKRQRKKLEKAEMEKQKLERLLKNISNELIRRFKNEEDNRKGSYK